MRMTRNSNVGPKLAALLDERDTLRVRISLADDNSESEVGIGELRRRLYVLDRAILKQWETPDI
jgi:hypothetical protein